MSSSILGAFLPSLLPLTPNLHSHPPTAQRGAQRAARPHDHDILYSLVQPAFPQPQPAMQPRNRPPLLTISGSCIAYAHTVLGFSAFFGALILALSLHYHQVVKNHVAGWPQEWWPSVSAAIGDWPQERAVLQIFIALASGPRIALVLLSALLVSLSNPQSSQSKVLAFTGILRTLSCGGWVFCTSTDLPLVHDVAMILYLVLTPAWMFISWGSLAPQPDKEDGAALKLTERSRKTRRNTAMAFFASIPFMCLCYYRHRVLRIPGAYTIYSFFEWNLIVEVRRARWLRRCRWSRS